jgi:hypothetical protein
MRRFAGVLIMLVGAAICGYFAWCGHRLGYGVLGEPGWPRPWPYPDEWLLRWARAGDAADPAPPGHIKFHGELDRLRARVRLYAACGGLALGVGLLLALWPRRGRPAAPAAAPEGARVPAAVTADFEQATGRLVLRCDTASFERVRDAVCRAGGVTVPISVPVTPVREVVVVLAADAPAPRTAWWRHLVAVIFCLLFAGGPFGWFAMATWSLWALK